MKIISKTLISAVLAVSALGLTTSLSAYADGASDAAFYCTGCHAGLTVESATGAVLGVVGAGKNSCPQRTVAEWTDTINRMNVKGCGLPAANVAGVANYLAAFGQTATTTTTVPVTTTTVPVTTTTVPVITTTVPVTTTTVPGVTTTVPGVTTTVPGVTTTVPGVTTTTVATTTTTTRPSGGCIKNGKIKKCKEDDDD